VPVDDVTALAGAGAVDRDAEGAGSFALEDVADGGELPP
jgi:hypothetical protein